MNTPKIILFSMIISGISFDILGSGMGSDHGLEAAKVMAPAIKVASEQVNEAARELGIKTIKEISPHIKDFVQSLPNLGSNIGAEPAKILASTMEKIANAIPQVGNALTNGTVETAKVLAPGIQELAKSMPTAGADFGKNFGLETTKAVGGGIVIAGTKAKTALLAAKKAAVVIASSPAAPYVAIGVGVIVVSYGGYKVYRYYHPTEEQIAAAKKLQIEIAKSQEKLDKLKHKAEIVKRESELKEALLKHSTDTCNQQGIPFACQREALQLALVAGDKRVERTIESFTKFKPQQERWA